MTAAEYNIALRAIEHLERADTLLDAAAHELHQARTRIVEADSEALDKLCDKIPDTLDLADEIDEAIVQLNRYRERNA